MVQQMVPLMHPQAIVQAEPRWKLLSHSLSHSQTLSRSLSLAHRRVNLDPTFSR